MDPRWTRIAVAGLAALLVAFVVTLATGSGAKTAAGRIGGDFPAFYAAGTIASHGDVEKVFDAERLEAQERDLGVTGGYIAFPYPPYVAELYRPFAALPYRVAYALHTLLMVAALVAGIWLLRPLVPSLARNPLVLGAAVALCFPMLRALTGGQNTPLTFLLLVASWRLLARHPYLAGVVLGLLLFKPQAAVLVVVLHALWRRWRVVAGFAAAGAATWAVNAAFAGAGWLGRWQHVITDYAKLEAKFNATNAISFPSVADTIFGYGTTASHVVGYALALAAFVVVVWCWRRGDATVQLAAVSAGVLLVSLHTVYYDAGVAAVAALVLYDRGGRAGRRAAAVLWVASFVHVLADAARFDPLVLVVTAALGGVVVVARRATRRRRRAAPWRSLGHRRRRLDVGATADLGDGLLAAGDPRHHRP